MRQLSIHGDEKSLSYIVKCKKARCITMCTSYYDLCVGRDILTHIYLCLLMFNLWKETQETGNACFWSGNNGKKEYFSMYIYLFVPGICII